ncbi:prepilin-type N-terminal cleavage/methylation domain-containing protein [bacterium]|nr:MAG: prepilin-type N-terminal cleavage/methylation domain-containing protein [bacterium]
MTTNATPASETTSLPRAFALARGTSLIELVIVLSIVVILAAIAMPRYASATGRRRVTAAASRLVSDIAAARNQARNTSSPTTMTWTIGTGQYTWASANVRTRSTVVDLSKSPYETLVSSISAGGDSAIVFSGMGSPDSGGTVQLRCGVWQIPVNIDSLSGVASVGQLSNVPVITVSVLDE